jgi:hypothetical protein
MPLALPEPLLALASAVVDDGGGTVLSVLEAILADAAPFDVAEVALRRGGVSERFHLSPGRDVASFTADDVLDRVMADGALRLDDLGEADPFPRTRERMKAEGLRSLLAVPFAAGGAEGMVALGRRQGWAFVGASLHVLGPIVSMAGLALDRSLALTRTAQAARETRPPVEVAVPDPRIETERDALRSRCESLATEAESARRDAAQRAEALSVRDERVRTLEDAQRTLEARVAQLLADRDTQRAALEDERARSAALDAARQSAEAAAQEAEARSREAEAWKADVLRLTAEAEAGAAELARLRADALAHAQELGGALDQLRALDEQLKEKAAANGKRRPSRRS